MSLLLNPLFWLAVLAIYLLVQIKLPFSRSFYFGVLNSAVLLALLGVRSFTVALFFTLLIWVVVYILKALGKKKNLRAFAVLTALTAIGLAACFVLHKIHLERKALINLLFEGIPHSQAEFVLSSLAALSFSYVFLRAMDLFFASGLREAELLDPVSLTGYLFPFHMLASGPLTSYRDHLQMNKVEIQEPAFSNLLQGINLITTGLFYKFVLAECLKVLSYGVNATISPPSGILGSAGLLVYVFLDFAGYSKIALGIGNLINVPTPVNFNAPLLATSVTDFWQRWHMSLSSFVKRNIYTPLQLSAVRKLGLKWASTVGLLTLVVSFSFVGIWHKICLPFLYWGMAMGAIMYLEKLVRDKVLKYSWANSRQVVIITRIIGPFYVLITISVSMLFIWQEIFTNG